MCDNRTANKSQLGPRHDVPIRHTCTLSPSSGQVGRLAASTHLPPLPGTYLAFWHRLSEQHPRTASISAKKLFFSTKISTVRTTEVTSLHRETTNLRSSDLNPPNPRVNGFNMYQSYDRGRSVYRIPCGNELVPCEMPGFPRQLATTHPLAQKHPLLFVVIFIDYLD